MKKKLISNSRKIDFFLKKYLNKQKHSLLIDPMKYGLLYGGKKIRSSVILDTGKLFNLKFNKLVNLCAAVECIHSYSLIHDDLPCMDNDSVRRGKPSTHVRYGESTAVLAGNSLLTLAFEIIADKKYKIDSNSKIEIIKYLAFCSGHTGIAGGQELDLSFEKKRKNSKQIIDMQRKKTGKLFNFCCYVSGVIAKKNKKEKIFLSSLGEDLGLLFQLADDFLDVKGSKKITGKPTKKDSTKGKSTLINLMGYKKAYKYANNLKINILRKLKKHGKKAKDLNETIEFILGRNF
ncbi:MAG: geranyl transferase [Candidatus Pelagibacter sp.]|nr:geranyl transferase [Candidatus Pelagibacter sp.]RPG12092.1 MAG: polyprenyl synthetase family protein [Pelagibacteraceae bacterium TMED170]